ncbi:hypothetical protein BHE74_00040257, partial [Ensete ventricosum]
LVMSPKLILQPRRGFFSPRATDRDRRGKAALELQLLPVRPSPSADTARQRAVTVEINCYRLISCDNGAETAPIGGTARYERYPSVLQTLMSEGSCNVNPC